MINCARLRELRKNKGLKQRELGKLLSLSGVAISLYETGKRQPDTETLRKLANFFGVSTDYLLGETDDPNPSKSEDVSILTEKDLEKMPSLIRESVISYIEMMKKKYCK